MSKKVEYITLSKEKCKLIRSHRENKNLKQKDLEDEMISAATISTIELGARPVSKERIMHLAEKLGILDEISENKSRNKQQEELLWAELQLIKKIAPETPNIALQELNQLDLQSHHPFFYFFTFIKGICYTNLGKWKKAQETFSNVIKLIDQSNPESLKDIKPSCLGQLGRCMYYQNDFNAALNHTEKGLHLNSKLNKQNSEYLLLLNKSTYLDKLDRNEEALNTIEELYHKVMELSTTEILEVGLKDVILKMYNTYAYILNKHDMHQKALDIGNKGLDIAIANGIGDSQYYLWDTLGNIYYDLNELKKTERCYKMALNLKSKIKKKDTNYIVNTYTGLGKLYIKKSKLKEAENALEKAKEYHKKTDDVYCKIEVSMTLGDLFRLQKKYREATKPYTQAIQFADKYQFIQKKKRCLSWLGECWKQLNENDKYIQCTTQLHELEVSLISDERG